MVEMMNNQCSPLKRKAAMIECTESSTDDDNDEDYLDDESEYHADDEGESRTEDTTHEGSNPETVTIPVAVCIHDPFLRKRTRRSGCRSLSCELEQVIITRTTNARSVPNSTSGVTCTHEMPAGGPTAMHYPLYSLGRLFQTYLTEIRQAEHRSYNENDQDVVVSCEAPLLSDSTLSSSSSSGEACIITGKQLCIEQAMQFTKTPHVMVEAGFPFRIVHANAAFYAAILKQHSTTTTTTEATERALDCMTQYHSLQDTITRTFGTLPTTVHPVSASEGHFISHYMVELAQQQRQEQPFSVTPPDDLTIDEDVSKTTEKNGVMQLHPKRNVIEPKRAVG